MRFQRQFVLQAAVAGLLLVPRTSDAVNKTWIGGNALWSNAAAWNPVNQPAAGDAVFLTQGAVTCTLDATATIPLLLGIGIGNSMTLSQTGGTFSAGAATMSITNGTYSMSGGTMTFGTLTVAPVGVGTVLLTAGALTTSAATLGGAAGSAGTVVISGGSWRPTSILLGDLGSGTIQVNSGVLNASSAPLTINANGFLQVNTTGVAGLSTVNMTGGTFAFNSSSATISYTNFNQSAGVFNIGAAVTMSVSSGTFNLSGGTFGGAAVATSGTARFVQTGGSFTPNSLSVGSLVGSSSTCAISGGSANFSNLLVGRSGAGTVDLAGGSVTANVLMLGQNLGGAGRLILTDGTLTTGGSTAILGGLGAATVEHSGGVFTASIGMQLGSSAGGSGTYNMTGAGAVLNSTSVDVGLAGNGYVKQNAGSVLLSGTLGVSRGSGAGTYLLAGGVLSAATIDVQAGGFFDHAAGTITATTRTHLNGGFIGLLTNIGTFLFTSGSASAITNAGSATLSGVGTFNVGTFTNTAAGSLAIGTARMIVGSSTALGGTISMAGGTLAVAGDLIVAPGNAATFSHAGSVSADQLRIATGGGTGSYALTAGSLDVAALTIAENGVATFTHSGGSANVAGLMQVGPGTGFYGRSGGTLTAGSLLISGGSTFTQAGGQSNVSDLAFISGMATLGGGSMSSGSVMVAAGGNLALAGGALITPLVQVSGGAFTATTGTLDVDLIALSGGTLNVAPAVGFTRTLTQTGGTLVGPFTNNGTYNYGAGAVTGDITNHGLIHLNASLSVGGRLDNFGAITVPMARSIGSGTMLANFGTFTLAGGTISGTAFRNEAGGYFLARGTLATSSASVNDGVLELDGLFTGTAALSNSGVVYVGLGDNFRPLGGLNNTGQVVLSGGAISSGSVSNSSGGVIRGGGSMGGAAFAGHNTGIILAEGVAALTLPGAGTNGGGGQLRIAAGATMVAGNWTNRGVIELQGGAAQYSGGTLNNAAGMFRGSGVVSVGTLINTAVVRADGELDFTAGFFNLAGGTLEIPAGGRATFQSGIASQVGNITLGGGTLNAGPGMLTNAGQIVGNGAVRAGTISNAGTIILSGDVSRVFAALSQTVSGQTIITGFGTTTFFGDVTNGVGTELRVSTGATAIFLGDVNGLSRITGGGVKVFEGSAAGGPLVTPGSSIVAPGATLETSGVRETSLTVRGSASIDNTITSRLNTLTIAGSPDAWTGRFDLDNGVLILDYTGASSCGVVENQIRSGFNGGAWTGTGIRSSAAAAQSNRAVGIAEAVDLGSPPTFLGEPIDASTLLMRITLPGDANLSGNVNISDFALLAANFNLPGYWAKGDFNYDGSTNIGDFALLAANFNLSLPIDLPRGTAVPEPVAGVAAVWLALACRRRR